MMNPAGNAAGGTEQPLKICVVFDDDVSACGAQVLIRHVASDFACDTQSFRFDSACELLRSPQKSGGLDS